MTPRFLSLTAVLTVIVAVACGGTSFVGEEGQGGTGGLGGAGGAQGGASANGGSGGNTGGSGNVGGTGGSGNVGGSVSAGGSGNVGGSGAVGGSGSVGGSGAVGGDGGVGGASAAGGVGAVGGTGAVAGMPTGCSDPDGQALDGGVTTQVTTVGVNGSFTDYCDDGGNLIEHYCEPLPCGVPPQADAIPAGSSGIGVPCQIGQSGNVLELPVDCGGRCSDGACEQYCTDFGQTFTVTNVGVGQSVIAVDLSGQHVACSIIAELDGFLCADASLQNRVMTVVALGTCSPASFTMGVTYAGTTDAQDCSYTCTTVDPPPEI